MLCCSMRGKRENAVTGLMTFHNFTYNFFKIPYCKSIKKKANVCFLMEYALKHVPMGSFVLFRNFAVNFYSFIVSFVWLCVQQWSSPLWYSCSCSYPWGQCGSIATPQHHTLLSLGKVLNGNTNTSITSTKADLTCCFLNIIEDEIFNIVFTWKEQFALQHICGFEPWY